MIAIQRFKYINNYDKLNMQSMMSISKYIGHISKIREENPFLVNDTQILT